MADVENFEAVISELESDRGKLETKAEQLRVQYKELSLAIEILKDRIRQKQDTGEEQVDDYSVLSFTEAARMYLNSVDEPATVYEIWEALQKGGFTSDAQNPVSALSASMSRNHHFEHQAGSGWVFKELPDWQL